MADTELSTPALDDLDQVLAELSALRGLDHLRRAAMVRGMDNRVRAVLGRVGDEAVTLASLEPVGTRRRTHADLARVLGVSAYRVNAAIVSYRRWLASRNGGA